MTYATGGEALILAETARVFGIGAPHFKIKSLLDGGGRSGSSGRYKKANGPHIRFPFVLLLSFSSFLKGREVWCAKVRLEVGCKCIVLKEGLLGGGNRRDQDEDG